MKKYLALILIVASTLFAQQNQLTGNIAFDQKIAFDETYSPDKNFDDYYKEHSRSVWLAAALSAAFPGAGEIYNKSYIKAGLFMAAEAAAITVGLIYDKKGDDQTATFEKFAQQHWSVARYALWTITNLSTLNPNLNPDDYAGLFTDASKTSVNWRVLNQLEEDIGGYYSHRLAPYGDQQYYEMIGKYQQFNPGWDDFGDEHTPYTYGDPLTDRYLFYSGLRGKANEYYDVAGTAVIMVIVNHILSTLDAVWDAAHYNKSLKTSVSLHKQYIGTYTLYYPELNFKLSF